MAVRFLVYMTTIYTTEVILDQNSVRWVSLVSLEGVCLGVKLSEMAHFQGWLTQLQKPFRMFSMASGQVFIHNSMPQTDKRRKKLTGVGLPGGVLRLA